ncbi:lamin tail domain-containing protein [Verrucomicrobiaceae bacterium 227]
MRPSHSRFFRILPALPFLSSPLFAAPVINEIHYNNDENTIHNEFVEIYNPDAVSHDLSGWELDGAVSYTFPPGTSLPSNGYLVIADDPSVITSEFSVPALGPYSGGLNSEGELLQLLDSSGAEQDRVEYGIGFPWPSRARGGGSSMELINPALDNDLGSSWRSSQLGFNGLPETFIPQASTWSYRKGLSEASAPIHAWTAPEFAQDASWLSGPAPIGRGEPAIENTKINDAQGNYSSVFLRKEFTISGNPPSALNLKLLYDDGVIVWLNGTEVYRSPSVTPGLIDFEGGDPSGTDAIKSHEQNGYEPVVIGGTAGLLQSGTNVIAIQLFNDSIGSSDILIDAVLETPEPFSEPAPPSPGKLNASSTATPPPNIRQVEHLPLAPSSSDPVTISAKVTDPDGVDSVILSYQVVDPGSYIRKSDPAYEENWLDLEMTKAGDSQTYSAVIPAQDHRHLVRYRITSTDSPGASVVAPFSDDEQPNFAYFIYDGLPAWSGANRPGVDAAATFDPSLLEKIPPYHLIADANDVTTSQYSSSAENRRFWGTLVYDNVVYDHIEYKIRGEFSTYQSGKNKWRFYFNRTRNLEARDNYGEKYREPWDELTLNACASPWAAVNRGMSGLDEALSYRTYQLAGMASPNTNYLHLRIIDEDAESTPGDQYRGDLWGLYLAVEQPDGSFLDERGLPDGNVYKIENGGAGTPDKKHQGKDQTTATTDWTTFTNQSASTNTEAWWRENLDLEAYYTFRTLNRALGNVDLRDGWNHYFYHSSNPDGSPGKWVPVPWDLDMMYICLRHQGGTIRQRNSLNIPALNIEFKNRAREILDLMLSDPSTTGGQIGQLLDEYAGLVNPIGEPLTWADLDRHMWNYHPRTRSSGSAQTNHKGNFHATPYTDSRFAGSWTRTLTSPDFEGSQNYILQYMTDTDPPPQTWSENSGDQRGYGFNFVSSEAADNNIPNTPVITYTGEAGFPTTGLTFTSSAFSDPQGSGSFGAMEWRIAEIDAPVGEPRTYEIEENWSSGELPSFEATITPPALATRPDRTYRARVRHQDTTGRWSHWSAPLEFQSTSPNIDLLQQNLVISEIMFNPDGDDAREFLELFNAGDTALDLTNVRFTKGIDFDFESGTTLAPGAYLLVVKNRAAFEAEYGPGLPLAAGQYEGNASDSLSNSGELIKLSLGTLAIHEFEYLDETPWPSSSDGSGYSLVLAHTSDNAGDLLDPLGHGTATNWRASFALGGSPGTSEPTDTFTGPASADLDFDGLNAFLEHALGTSDSLATIHPFGVSAANGQAHFTFPVNPLADDVHYLVETSSDLNSWLPLENLTARTSTSMTFSTELDVPASRFFFRLRIQNATPIPQ